MSKLTFKYRLYPTAKQSALLEWTLACCQELYNAALQERRDAWKLCRKSVGFNAQSDQLPEIKEIRPELSGIYSQVLQDVLHRVDKTFKAFFARVKRVGKAGFPRFKARARYDSLTYPQLGFSVVGSYLQLSKIGDVKIRLHREIQGKVKTLTIKRECEKWYACFSVEYTPEPLPVVEKPIGIDVGLDSFAVFNDGRRIENPRYYRKAQRKLRITQRRVARRKKGSNRWRKAVQILARIHEHIFNQQNNFQHKLAYWLVQNYGFIAVEDLNVKGMMRGRLAKSVQDGAWSAFIAKLTYKAENAGRQLVRVDARGTSQRCICGAAVKKKLSDRTHVCIDCGLIGGRDHVSAREILRLGLSLQTASTANQAMLV